MADTGTLSPVFGLRAIRAPRLRVLKMPKPAIRTSSSFASPSAIASNTVSTALSALNLFTPIRSATRAIIADLFMCPIPPIPRRSAFALPPPGFMIRSCKPSAAIAATGRLPMPGPARPAARCARSATPSFTTSP